MEFEDEADYVESDIWYHGRREELPFQGGRPIFFADKRDDVELWANDGVVVTARINTKKPAFEDKLLKLAEELGLDDVFSDDSEFPDVSTYLYDERVRQRLDEEGYDCYRGEDGFLYVTVVWNPDLIEVLSIDPWNAPATPSP